MMAVSKKLMLNQDVTLILGNVACSYHIIDETKPLIFCFATAGSVVPSEKLKNRKFLSLWGFDFVKKQKLNVICFASIDKPCWYLSPEFHKDLLKFLQLIPNTFERKLGYASSMGGMIGAFSKILQLDSVLLINPITTVSPKLVPWESRFWPAHKLDWDVPYCDGALAKCGGIVVYDNIFGLDKKHADRLAGNFERLVVPGVGHCMPSHLLKLGVLKKLFLDFVNGSVCKGEFQKKVRSRRFYYRYYDWLLSDQNKHKSRKRIKIIKKYRYIFGSSDERVNEIEKEDVDKIRELAIKLEPIDLSLSLRLMELAHKARPEGKYIEKKLLEYKEITSS